jgi:hypothetical protein
MTTNHPGMRAALLAAASTLVLVAACSANRTTASGGQPGTSASPAPSGPAGEGTGADGGAGDTRNGSGNTGNDDGTATKSPTPKPSTSPVPGPKIVSFTVTQQPACPAKGPAPTVNYPGQNVILSWKVTGATKVALSVDGPGIYRDTYKPEDMEELGFGCDTSQAQSKHTYLLTATGNGGTATQSLTVTVPSNP